MPCRYPSYSSIGCSPTRNTPCGWMASCRYRGIRTSFLRGKAHHRMSIAQLAILADAVHETLFIDSTEVPMLAENVKPNLPPSPHLPPSHPHFSLMWRRILEVDSFRCVCVCVCVCVCACVRACVRVCLFVRPVSCGGDDFHLPFHNTWNEMTCLQRQRLLWQPPSATMHQQASRWRCTGVKGGRNSTSKLDFLLLLVRLSLRLCMVGCGASLCIVYSNVLATMQILLVFA